MKAKIIRAFVVVAVVLFFYNWIVNDRFYFWLFAITLLSARDAIRWMRKENMKEQPK